jgi:hypothetical protein
MHGDRLGQELKAADPFATLLVCYGTESASAHFNPNNNIFTKNLIHRYIKCDIPLYHALKQAVEGPEQCLLIGPFRA